MDSKNEKYEELRNLICELVDGTITPEKRDKLNRILVNDPDAVNHYVEFLDIQILIKSNLSNIEKDFSMPLYLDEVQELTDLWHQLAKEEVSAPEVSLPKEQPERELIQKVVYPPRGNHQFSKFGIYSLAACAAMVLFFVYLYFAPQKPSSIEVATLVDQMNAQWGSSDVKFNNGDRLWTNAGLMELKKGVVKIQYDDDVILVIEGPSVFTIQRSELYLEYGRLYSKVSDFGLGFTVKTPTSKFVDLGTEFGVKADIDGSSELHVTKGKVQLFVGTDGKSRISQTLTENRAARYNANLNQVKDISIEKYAFVRQIDSKDDFIWRGQTTYNLADVVGGGDGFGKGRINYGIDHEGQTKLLDHIAAYIKPAPFTSVPSNPFVEGVFVPHGLTQIDSSSEDMYDFGSTSGGYYLGILNGAWHQQRDNAVPRHALRLGGLEYGTLEHPAIYIHANQGITFDLQAIREYTKMEIDRFTSNCGLSETYGNYAEAIRKARNYQDVKRPKASFCVLVDGREKFIRNDMTYLDGPVMISIDIAPQDRFLTLVTTEGSDKNDGDWTLFGEPILILHNE